MLSDRHGDWNTGMAKRAKRNWGTGCVVPPRKAGGAWGVRWREGSRRRYEGGLPTGDDARRFLAKIRADLVQNRTGLLADRRNAPTIGKLAPNFLQRRLTTHRAGYEDKGRWENHIGPHFDHLKPFEVDAAIIKRFVERKLGEGMKSGTVRILVALLSSLFEDLHEGNPAQLNPARNLPASIRRLIKPDYDPRTTPFIEKLENVRRIQLALPAPLNVAYAIGALAGLRTGEVFALKWSSVDLEARRIHVRESVKGPLKDKVSRFVPVLDPLLPILKKWKLETGGEGLVIPPLRSDGKKIDKATPGNFLRKVLIDLGLARPGFGLPDPGSGRPQKLWYWCTRHTFASQWVMAGGTIEKLKEVLGHYSIVVTERYAHLRTDLFTAKDLATIPLDLTPGDAQVVEIGQRMGSSPKIRAATHRILKKKNRSRPVSRVLSRGASRRRGDEHSSGPRVAARLERAVPEG
jgi:integrase